jgi:hypothetical protein
MLPYHNNNLLEHTQIYVRCLRRGIHSSKYHDLREVEQRAIGDGHVGQSDMSQASRCLCDRG